jgi:hypothetical protein
MIVGRKNSLRQKTGHLKIKDYKFERVESFKCLGVLLHENNSHHIHLQEIIKKANKTYFMLQKFFKSKNISRKLKLILKNTIIDRKLAYALDTLTPSKRDRKQLNIFESKVYRGTLGPVYDKEKETWRILTNEEVYAMVKNPTITETIRIHRLRWFGHVQRMEENRTHKRVLSMKCNKTKR